MDGQPYTGNAIGQPGSPQPLPGYGGQEQKGSRIMAKHRDMGMGMGQAIPMQGMGQQQQSQYHTAMPLQNLTEGAAPVDCPACRQRALTRTEYVSGNSTMYVSLSIPPPLLPSFPIPLFSLIPFSLTVFPSPHTVRSRLLEYSKEGGKTVK